MKISELTPTEVLNDEDIFPVVQDGETKQVKRNDLFKNLPTPTEDGDAVNKRYVDEQIKEVEIPVDSALDENSTNAIQNAVVAKSFKNVEKYYSTIYDIAALNGVKINIKGSNFYPFSFSYHKGIIANNTKAQIIIKFQMIPSITVSATGEEYVIFSNTPKLSDITATALILNVDGSVFESDLDELADIFKEAISDENSIIRHTRKIQKTTGTYVYDTLYEEVYIETTNIDVANTIYEEIEPLLSLISQIAVDYKESDVLTQEGELIYE